VLNSAAAAASHPGDQPAHAGAGAEPVVAALAAWRPGVGRLLLCKWDASPSHLLKIADGALVQQVVPHLVNVLLRQQVVQLPDVLTWRVDKHPRGTGDARAARPHAAGQRHAARDRSGTRASLLAPPPALLSLAVEAAAAPRRPAPQLVPTQLRVNATVGEAQR
jgi:hypothetical protein